MPNIFTLWRPKMRKMLSFGIATMLTAVAITAWAMGTTRPQHQSETGSLRINTLMLMPSATDLQVQSYDEF